MQLAAVEQILPYMQGHWKTWQASQVGRSRLHLIYASRISILGTLEHVGASSGMQQQEQAGLADVPSSCDSSCNSYSLAVHCSVSEQQPRPVDAQCPQRVC